MTTSPPTWDQVIATKHWHACDLDTHTLAQCSQLARRDDALDWGGVSSREVRPMRGAPCI